MSMQLEESDAVTVTSQDAEQLEEQALRIRKDNPEQALILLAESAQLALKERERRRAAIILHKRAALSLQMNASPIADLALAAQLLRSDPEARALILLDLGQALAARGDLHRATLVLRESEKLARQVGHAELTTAARYALGEVANEKGDFISARTFLRSTGMAMIVEVEGELLSTLRDIGNLPDNPQAAQERARRQQMVEDELAALKQELNSPIRK
jgi:tetratricopeptide (TPR) repeat protein